MKLLIMSCDANVDLVNILLKQLKKNVDSNYFDCIYVVTERINIEDDRVITICVEGSFSMRLAEAIEYMDDVFLLLLDDFISEAKIDTSMLNDIFGIVSSENVACCELTYMPNSIPCDNFSNLDRMPHSKRFCLQAGIWDKKELSKLLRPKENAWETELFGSVRAKKQKLTYLCLNKKTAKPYPYNDGWLVVQKKWNLDEVKRLKELGIPINLNNRLADDEFKGWKGNSLITRMIIKLKIIYWNILVVINPRNYQ